jgi:aldehyde dehydrogenase (NAD+)
MKDILNDQKIFYQSQTTRNVQFRLNHLKKLKKAIVKYKNDIYKALYDDFKKSEFEVISSEIGVVISELNKTIKNLKKWNRPKRVLPSFLNFPSSAKIYHEAYGNVLIISPWNYPFNLALTPLVGAIAGGNTVLLKPSELSPNTSNIIKIILEEVFNKKYVAVIEGDATVAQNLLKLKWDYIFFTGSPRIGKYVYQAAAKHLTPVTLELGGKSPVIIDRTANLKLAARRIVWGKFINAGQTCIAPDYILIDSFVSDKFLQYVKKEIRIQYGENPQNSQDFPRIINKANFNRLKDLMTDSDIILGGEYDESENYIAPTVILNPDSNSIVMQGEIFGPLLPVITYDSLDSAEEIIKKYPNPLAFYIFSTDKRAQKYFINKYAFGGGVINDTVVHFVNNRLPFGGVGESGINKYHGKHSFMTFTREKSIVKRYNWLDIPIRYLPSTDIKKKLIKLFLTG